MRSMGARRDTGRTEAQAVTIDELLIADEPDRWAALGFTVDGGRCQLGGVRLAFTGPEPGRGIVGWSLRGVASTRARRAADDAVRSGRRSAPRQRARRTACSRSITSSRSHRRSSAACGRSQAAGLDLRRVREEPTPAGAPRQAFFRLGEVILEVVAGARGGRRARRRGGAAGALLGPRAARRGARAHGRAAGRARGPDARGGAAGPAASPPLRRSAGLTVPLALMSAPARPRSPERGAGRSGGRYRPVHGHEQLRVGEAADADRLHPRLGHRVPRRHRRERRAAEDPDRAGGRAGGAAVDRERLSADAQRADPDRRLARGPVWRAAGVRDRGGRLRRRLARVCAVAVDRRAGRRARRCRASPARCSCRARWR